jgi:hypothetical protein
VKADDGAQEDAPQNHRPAADREQHEAQSHERNVVVGVQPAIERHGAEVGRILRHEGGVVVVRVAKQDPPHVRPEATVPRCVRIAVVIGMLMMDAMRRNPENWPAFERQRAADGEKVFERLRCLVAPMGMQAVIPEADPEPDRQPVQHDGDRKIGPTEKEKGGDRQNMKDHHHDGGDPVQCRM